MTGRLTQTPVITTRAAQPYVAIREEVTMQTLGPFAERTGDVVLAWLTARGIEPSGPPFLRYLVIDMDRALVVESGWPVATATVGDDAVRADVLPGGRYVEVAEVGHPDHLVGVIGDLLTWADEQGLVWDAEPEGAGERWGCRLEVYPTDPADEPDMSRWTTELAFRLAD